MHAKHALYQLSYNPVITVKNTIIINPQLKEGLNQQDANSKNYAY